MPKVVWRLERDFFSVSSEVFAEVEKRGSFRFAFLTPVNYDRHSDA